MIDTNQIQGQWNYVLEHVKQKWNQLAEADLDIPEGDVEQLIIRIQRKTGDTRQVIEDALRELAEQGGSMISHAAQAAGDCARGTARTLKQGYDQMARKAREGWDQAEDAVRQRPIQSVATFLVSGIVLGLFIGLALNLCRSSEER